MYVVCVCVVAHGIGIHSSDRTKGGCLRTVRTIRRWEYETQLCPSPLYMTHGLVQALHAPLKFGVSVLMGGLCASFYTI